MRSLCRRLLLTDFVTDLRAAIHNASDGKPLNVDPFSSVPPRPAAARDRPGIRGPCRGSRPCSRRSGLDPACPQARRSMTRPRPPRSRPPHSRPRRRPPGGRGLCAASRSSPLEACPLSSTTARFPASETGGSAAPMPRCAARSGQAAAIETPLRDQIARRLAARARTSAASRTPRILLAFLLEVQGKQSLADAQWQSLVLQLPARRRRRPVRPCRPELPVDRG